MSISVSYLNKNKLMKMSLEDPIFPASSYTLLYGSLAIFTVLNAKRIATKVFEHLFYTPGVSTITTNKKIKHRVATFQTDLGRVDLPLLKMGSFELQFGFFEKPIFTKSGLHKFGDFMNLYGGEFPDHETLKTAGNSWILNYRRPKDFRGRGDLTGFILSEIDDVIYIFDVLENDYIEYEDIMRAYDLEIENLPSDPPTEESVDDWKSSTSLPEQPGEDCNSTCTPTSDSIQDPPPELVCDDFTCIDPTKTVVQENITDLSTGSINSVQL